jgi:hypothetical protein
MGLKLISRAVDFLQTVSGAAVGAHMLRVLRAQATLLPISSLPDDELHTANVALICLINIMGNQESHQKGQDSPIMRLRPDVLSVGNAPYPPVLLPFRQPVLMLFALFGHSIDRARKHA